MLNNFTSGFTSAVAGTVRASVYVGDTCHDSTQTGLGADGGKVGKQVELCVPAYQMLPDIELNYSENHMRDVSNYDYYQFTLKGFASTDLFNRLVS